MSGIEKRCSKCRRAKPLVDFRRDRSQSTGFYPQCKECEITKRAAARRRYGERNDAQVAAEDAERLRRLESDFEALKPEDFDVSIGNDGRRDPNYNKQKRQEFSRAMGEYYHAVKDFAASGTPIPERNAAHNENLGEQERRWLNKRLARNLSLYDAQERLSIQNFKRAADEYFTGRIQASGYSAKKPNQAAKRSVVLLLSDLHIGAELHALDEPIPFRAIEEARRLEYILRQTLDYKPQYRKNSELVLLLNGDVIEGKLGHDGFSGAPLTEQKAAFWSYFETFIAYCAQEYPSVRVVCQPGNHGRDTARHQGRATARKWDGHEWECYYALSRMSSGLLNVTWQIDFRAVSAVDLYGSILGLTHSDTEIKIGHPDAKAAANRAMLDRVNMSLSHGHVFDALAVGHWHTARFHPGKPAIIYNGMLVPPNGWARSQGMVGEPCGQWIWEAIEGHPIGDLRFIGLSETQDRDEQLGSIIRPFRFKE